MIKEVPCMDCDGKGFIAIYSEYSVWSERCPNCGGTGIVKVPMTNADRIRDMSDEELAEMLFNYKECSKNCIMNNGKHCYQICEEKSVILKWLQQPAEEDT